MPITARPGFTPAGTQYTPTPMPTSYTVPIVEKPEDMDQNGNGSVYTPRPDPTQPGSPLGLPDNLFGFIMLMMGL